MNAARVPLRDDGDLLTPAGARYLEGWWRLGEDEALLVDLPAAAFEGGPYWGFLLYNVWGESFDWRNRRVSLNSREVERGADGGARIVVAHRDPGVPNWIDTAGHLEGSMSLRWIRNTGDLPKVATRVVGIAAL